MTTMAAAVASTSSHIGEGEGEEEAVTMRTTHNLDPHLRNSGKDSRAYGWRNTLNGRADDVGQLQVHLVGASGLYGADFGGKSDPFCTVRLGDLEYRSEVSRKTLEPEWKEQFHFDVRDMSEVLHVCVYDHDRFHDPEFLGRVSVPLLAMSAGKDEEDSHGERVFALKDKKMDKRARGKHPRIRLKFELDWNLARACVKTIRTPTKKDPPAFKRSLLISNVQRVRKILHFAASVSQYIQSCFNWEKPARSIRAFLTYELLVYYFQPFMFPLILLAFMVFIYPLYASYIVNDWLDPYYELVIV